MRVINRNNDNKRITVQIKKIDNDMITCKHVTSGYQVVASIDKFKCLEIGQIVIVEYQHKNGSGGYVVVDNLVVEMDAVVLEAQHLIYNGMMYNSLIIESLDTHKRMHSLVPSYTKIFNDTSIIIRGDKIKIKINNGNIFSIKH